MVEEVKVTRNYQVTLPAAARTKLGVKVGDVLLAVFQQDKIVFEKKTSDIAKLKIRLNRKIDWKDVEKTARDAGEQIAESSR